MKRFYGDDGSVQLFSALNLILTRFLFISYFFFFCTDPMEKKTKRLKVSKIFKSGFLKVQYLNLKNKYCRFCLTACVHLQKTNIHDSCSQSSDAAACLRQEGFSPSKIRSFRRRCLLNHDSHAPPECGQIPSQSCSCLLLPLQ